ncbi:monocarboxylate uptake permease MctP [Segnochrobactrum spirostomi]|uniref:Sodium:solute symporter family protein n=1 Tax=Segnochrobactrum spirostomi TaxID=2608987 RepID=A0A6A7Y090_9HYPH|nr:sodium:solute symporter family protein [Segnochrobactrum spirostomi]MQT12480.1 sodium:solute symporter family protein [Segnochrobactrum spirostomi]
MTSEIDPTTLTVSLFCFLLVTGLGFLATRWRRPKAAYNIDEWGLGGRSFGTWITWFLIGGDFYTAYTMIAVPALVYAVGAPGFFALPYTIIVYPFVFAVMPALWKRAKAAGYVTSGDVVFGQFGSRPLELAVALTGVVASMPYIALQLLGMAAALKALGLQGEIPLMIAFLVLAIYTYAAGLRAPALIAFVKDIMIYVVVVAAVVLIPSVLGGYGAVFTSAEAAFTAKGSGGILLAPNQYSAYATLALGSCLGAFMYPHTLTGILASKSANTIRKNAMLLPIYTILLGLLAMLGYMGHAAGLKLDTPNDVVPALFKTLFPHWFAGFAFAAIAIGALVPAAVMSIGSANLFTRNFWKAYVNPRVTPAGEAKVAKITSIFVKAGALLVILYLPTQFAINLQLLGGVWILQTLPALLFGLFTKWFRAPALLAGWAVGLCGGTYLVWDAGWAPIHAVNLGSGPIAVYTGLVALVLNIAVASAVNVLVRGAGSARAPTAASGR